MAEEPVGGPNAKPTPPFDETATIKVAESYTDSDKPGYLPPANLTLVTVSTGPEGE